jgi:hypothetical protein
VPVARFFFDAGSGTVLWRSDAEPGEPFVDLQELPVSNAEYDMSLNWEYPPDPGPWREEQCRRFNGAVREALDRLRAELPDWRIEDEFVELHEDPDLDRYLTDPARFRRRATRSQPLYRRWIRRS